MELIINRARDETNSVIDLVMVICPNMDVILYIREYLLFSLTT